MARFRALSPAERIEVIRDILATGAFLISISGKAEWIRQYTEEQEALAQRNIQEFIARHAHLIPEHYRTAPDGLTTSD